MSLNNGHYKEFKPYVFKFLMQYENFYKTMPTNSDHDWYKIFFGPLIIRDDKDKTAKNLKKIKVITFNYDRSLEYYLSNVLKINCFVTENDYTEVFKFLHEYLEIIHVYGRLPALINEDQFLQKTYSNIHTVDYGFFNIRNNLDIEYADRAIHAHSNTINFCYGNNEVNPRISDIFKNESEVVYFLGFGFHENNIKILNFEFGNHNFYISTGYNLNSSNVQFVKNNYPQILIARDCNIIDLLNKIYKFVDNEFEIGRLLI
ncbi:MAG: hypothetical protein ACK4VO_13060 [Pseudobdellovibrio sp.]